MVGKAGFEPTTSSSRTKRASQLRYFPKIPKTQKNNSEKFSGDVQISLNLIRKICLPFAFPQKLKEPHSENHLNVFLTQGRYFNRQRSPGQQPSLDVDIFIIRININAELIQSARPGLKGAIACSLS